MLSPNCPKLQTRSDKPTSPNHLTKPSIARLAAVTASSVLASQIHSNQTMGDMSMQKVNEVEHRTTRDYARAIADEIASYKPFVREDSNEHDGQFCCWSKSNDVYTVGYDAGGDIIIEQLVGFGWNVIWHGQWNPTTDMETFIERMWYGDTGDQLTATNDEDDEDDDESETDMGDSEWDFNLSDSE